MSGQYLVVVGLGRWNLIETRLAETVATMKAAHGVVQNIQANKALKSLKVAVLFLQMYKQVARKATCCILGMKIAMRSVHPMNEERNDN